MRKLAFAILLMIGMGAMAQKTGPEKGDRNYRDKMSPEQMATLQTKRMTLALDLTDAQQRQVQGLNVENAIRREEKMKEIKIKKEKGELRKLSQEERYNLQLAMLDHQIAQKNKMKKILDKDQYAKWEKMKTDRPGHHKERPMGSHKKRGHGK